MKKNVLIFGTGSYYSHIKKNIQEKYHIIAFIDNDSRKQGAFFEGKHIISPLDIEKYNYEKILVASSFFYDISIQLVNLGIPSNKVVFPFYDGKEALLKKVIEGNINRILVSVDGINLFLS
ncbi:nucleoside-diphosphate sugar epimerase/dehydratase, partial [Aneurinibacillus danicus]|uniref:nucleoside-diphosphate sugar epimerase/dehydratase n=1 Tax=Aneurinibacillus danicus TaxID=267746 RepID=UPI001C3F657B